MRPVGGLRIDGRIILKWILKKYGVRMWTGFVSRYGPMAGFCEHGNEPSGSVKGSSPRS
jgi:hypothetical protein